MLRIIAACLLFCAFFSGPAEARHHRHHGARHHVQHHVQHARHHFKHHVRHAVRHHRKHVRSFAKSASPTRFVTAPATIVPNPAGCPSRAFCGCGAALRVFGHHVRDLWLAANWYRFPRSLPAPGTVAVRPHHVMVLEAELSPGIWQVYDANSGGHATRIHARPIAGYTIVQPHSNRVEASHGPVTRLRL